MAEIVNIQNINPQTFELQEYSQQDTSLISTTTTFDTWDSTVDHIEYFIYDLNGNILYENVAGYPQYTLIDNNLVIDPENDLKSQGYLEGNYNTLYNFLKYRLSSNTVNQYYISQISADRTEIRLDTTTISNADVIFAANEFISYRNNSSVFIDFYLDFGNNNLVIANNILLDISNPNNPTILIKLYEPLPQQFDINSQCWVVESIAISSAYNINITQTFDIIQGGITLQGPNLNIAVKDQINNSTPFASYNSLKSSNSTLGTGSLQYQINSILAERGIEINIDYSDYNDFVYFSSAQTRLENFYYKLELLEEYQYSASISNTSPTSIYISASNAVWLSKINDIITNFDGYEYYLYYESGSTAWPKTNLDPPYINAGANSVAGLAFLASQSIVAENYDIQNNNRLINAIPSYISEDPNNSQYLLFTDMLGQSFDSVWVYIKDVTNKSNADNRINYGVSRDLVANVLRDLGVKIYQNNFSTDDLYSALIGLTPSGSLYNLPYTTGSLPVPAGTFLDYVNTYVTASATGSLIPTYDINSETYKRIYHNLPYLYKKKGTVEGLRALITAYGIPDTILRINEFGGKDKNPNTWDYWQDEYNYKFDSIDTNNYGLYTGWYLNEAWSSSFNHPETIFFRFKAPNLDSALDYSANQSLMTLQNGNYFDVFLQYTGSGYTTGAYNGAIPNPENEYAHLVIADTSGNVTASVYLPFFNGDWWSVSITKSGSYQQLGGTTFELTAGNKNYQGNDGNYVGFLASSSYNIPYLTIPSYDIAGNSIRAYYNVGNPSVALNGIYNLDPFSGSYQEIRYYNTIISQSVFEDYIMNPYSIEGNKINEFQTQLAFRATLGGELFTGSYSVHPKFYSLNGTSGGYYTSSFTTGYDSLTSNFFTSSNQQFSSNTEVFYYDQVPAGIQNAVSEKIQSRNIVLPYTSSNTNIKNIPNNNVLSPFRTLQQNIPISGTYTANVDYVEVAFSPQNEINEDINDSLGYFNIGEYIGDPREVPSRNTHYPELDVVRDGYFLKYIRNTNDPQNPLQQPNNYQYNDYIRLIKFFDNSLFKMIQDFIPAHTDLAAGIVIKQHLLERNRYPQPQVTPISTQYTYGSGSNPSIYWSTPEAVEDITITASIKGIPGLLDGQKIYTSSTQYESFPIETAIGGQGGTMPEFPGTASTDYFVNVTQSYNITTPSLLGYVTTLHDDKSEFFNGELSGSTIITDKLGNLTDPDCLPYLHASTTETPYRTIFFKSTDLGGSQTSITYFTNPQLAPNPGEIYLYWDSGSVYTSTPLVPQQSPGVEF